MGSGSLQMRRQIGRPVLAAVAVALAFAGGAACGGDDDESPGSGGAATPAQTAAAPDGKTEGVVERADAPALSGNVAQARAGATVVDQVYESFGAAVQAGVAAAGVKSRDAVAAAGGDESLAKVCDLMSEQAQRQTIAYAERSAGLADVKWTCEGATGLLLWRARQAGGLERSLRAEIVGVNTQGDRATASVRFGGRRQISSIQLVKEDGEWKLGASPSGGGKP